MLHHEFQVRTGDRLVTDVTDRVAGFVANEGDGICHVFVPHATAGIALMEVGSGSEQDLAAAVGRLTPRSADYRHRHGSIGHGGDHVLPVFVSPSISIPVYAGRLGLGTWQSIVVVDSNGDNPDRTVLLDFVAG